MPATTRKRGAPPARATAPRPRLRRSDCSGPGVKRLRRGRGFVYLDERGKRIKSTEELDRIRELAIPPAWEDVWVCPDPRGHLQATGVDAAGRRQYLYHPGWREHRDRVKLERMIAFADLLPGLRRRLARTLQDDLEPRREIVLASAVRLLDIGMFRVGSEQYADEDHGIGLATVRKSHVRVHDGAMEFDYPGKGGIRRRQVIEDPVTVELIQTLKRRRGGPELLAYREGRRWRDVRSDDLNDYLKEQLGDEFSAKDFRTWNATVMAAVTLAANGREITTETGRKRTINAAVRPCPSCSATHRRWRAAPTSIRAYSTVICRGGRSPRRSSGSPTSTWPTTGSAPGSSGRWSTCWSRTPIRRRSNR